MNIVHFKQDNLRLERITMYVNTDLNSRLFQRAASITCAFIVALKQLAGNSEIFWQLNLYENGQFNLCV